jgi:hypothetical protein
MDFFWLGGEREWIFSSSLCSDAKSIVLLRRLLETIRRWPVPLLNAFLQMPTVVGVTIREEKQLHEYIKVEAHLMSLSFLLLNKTFFIYILYQCGKRKDLIKCFLLA